MRHIAIQAAMTNYSKAGTGRPKTVMRSQSMVSSNGPGRRMAMMGLLDRYRQTRMNSGYARAGSVLTRFSVGTRSPVGDYYLMRYGSRT